MNDSEGGNGHEQKHAVEVITLDSDELMEAVHHYVLQKYGKGRIVEFKWVFMLDEGYAMPPMRDIAMECTIEPKR